MQCRENIPIQLYLLNICLYSKPADKSLTQIASM